jgi:hypothetical protein
VAISEGLRVLNYLDELPRDEVPDENIWHHSTRLTEWFEAVKQRRETGQKPIDEVEDAPMAQNALTLDYLNGDSDGD